MWKKLLVFAVYHGNGTRQARGYHRSPILVISSSSIRVGSDDLRHLERQMPGVNNFLADLCNYDRTV